MPALALVFHAIARVAGADDSIGVSLAAATQAAASCDYLEAHARRCYQCVTDATNSAAAALALKVRRGKLPAPFSVRDVYRAGWEGLSDKDDVWRAIDVLEKGKWLRREVSTPPNTKPSTQFWINPKVLEAKK